MLDRKSLQEARDGILKRFGSLDILINGAGGNKPRATTDSETMACRLIAVLQANNAQLLCERYKLQQEDVVGEEPYTVLERIGAKRGMKMRGGDVDTERAAITLLDEYRAGKLGRLSIETPELDG